MPPRRKAPSATRKTPEAPLTKYDKMRAQNIMRNNQVLQRLGVSALASMINNTSASRKGEGPQESGSVYEGQESEDSGQDEVNKASRVAKDAQKKSSKQTGNISATGARTSKRVIAPEQQDEPTRVTRQKTHKLPLTTSTEPQVPTLSLATSTLTHDDLVSGVSPTKHEERIGISDEEVLLTEYERMRAQNIMRNNQVLQKLGVSALASMINNTYASRKGEGSRESGSLYEGQESEDSGQEEVNKASRVAKDAQKKSSKQTGNISATGARTSKRVTAPEQQDEPTRVTRQKTPQQEEQEEQISTIDEGALTTSKDPERIRGKSYGRDLDRISRGLCSKIPIYISEGKRRPEAPMQAAKLASEGGIILRQHFPILTHWKEYKKDESHLMDYVGKIGAKFTMDTNSNAVRDACADLLKGGQRQMRYKLKKQYFNGVPANQVRTTSPVSHMTDDEWKALVDMWSDSKHKDKCIKNQMNREKVQFQQRTGSRCYIAQAHVVKQGEKYKDVEPTTIDLFKDFHCSKITSFSEHVKNAIADMETIMAQPVEEGQIPKSANQVVAQVVQSSTFLKNVGIKSSSKNISRDGASSQVQKLQAELDIEKQEKTELRQHIDYLKMQAQDSETAMAKQAHEIESLKKS